MLFVSIRILMIVLVIVDAIVHSRKNDLARLALKHEVNQVIDSGLFHHIPSLRPPVTVTAALYLSLIHI